MKTKIKEMKKLTQNYIPNWCYTFLSNYRVWVFKGKRK